MDIVVVCGTNRDGALSRSLANQVAGIYREQGHTVDLLDMAELPPETLSGSVYKDQPASLHALVERFLAADGVVFIVPEYNGGYPGVLKLFVDMLPYPEGFDSRPCAFIGIAAGQFKALRAVEHFQQIAGYGNAHMFPRRIFIGDSYSNITDGRLNDEELVGRIEKQATGFCKFVESVRALD